MATIPSLDSDIEFPLNESDEIGQKLDEIVQNTEIRTGLPLSQVRKQGGFLDVFVSFFSDELLI